MSWSPLDVDFVRARFAGLDGGNVFLDNAGGSLVLEKVVADIADYLRRCPVQLGASYGVSAEAARRVHSARTQIALLLGAGNSGAVQPEEVIFGASTTTLLRRLAEAKSPSLQPGDEVIVTAADHESNITPWLRLERLGVAIRIWQVNKDSLELEPHDLACLLSERTRVVSFTQATNITGTLTRSVEIIRLAHECGAEVCIDGVAAAPHRLPDVMRLDADYYVLSLYKCFGPHLAVLYGKRNSLAALASINHLDVGDERLPWKLEPGACAYELAYGAGSITAYLTELGRHHGADASDAASLERAYACITDHEAALAGRLLEYLRAKPTVTIIGRTAADARRLPIVSFTARELSPREIVAATDAHDIGIRHGHFYALRLIRTLDLAPDGMVRVSIAHYNTIEEIDCLIDVLETAL
ncbi:cysteine desulfurase-like protein [soil metagenome]